MEIFIDAQPEDCKFAEQFGNAVPCFNRVSILPSGLQARRKFIEAVVIFAECTAHASLYLIA